MIGSPKSCCKKEQILKDWFVLTELLGSDQTQVVALILATDVNCTAGAALRVVLGMHGSRSHELVDRERIWR